MCGNKIKTMQDIWPTELKVYVVIWSSAVFYAIFQFATESNKYFQYYNDDYSDFTKGWTVLSRKKDVADFEWQSMKFLTQKLSLWVILLTISSEGLRKYNLILVLQLWQILITTLFIATNLGTYPLLAILFQPIIFSLVLIITRSKFSIWLCNGVILFLISLYKYYTATEEFILLFKLTEQVAYISMITIFWINLRCVSYCLDCIDSKEKHNFISFLSYCLYLPNAFCGPFISYKDFIGSHQNRNNLFNRIKRLFMDIGRFSFWMFFAELCLHFIYVNAAGFHPEWVKSLDSWSLYGYGYAMGQFFHIKYLVVYGLATSIARFENVKVPSLPVCIGRIHLYSDMWKYFDAGLYNFLLRYIYIPSMKCVHSRPFSSFLCFLFVYVWHGTDDYILVWTFLNYIGVVVENFCSWFNGAKLTKKIGSMWFRRITCVAASPLLAMSAISNFYFFARSEIGNIFLNRFLNDNYSSNCILLGLLYTCCQVSTEVRNRRKNHKAFKTE